MIAMIATNLSGSIAVICVIMSGCALVLPLDAILPSDLRFFDNRELIIFSILCERFKERVLESLSSTASYWKWMKLINLYFS